jgi:integrase
VSANFLEFPSVCVHIVCTESPSEEAIVPAKITKRAVDALTAGAILADSEIKGFVARRLPSGAITYGYRYRTNHKQRWLPLGLHGRITPDEARGLAKRAAGDVARGHDPQAERTEARIVAEATTNKVLDAYLARSKKRKVRSVAEIESIFDRLVRPRIGERSVYTLERKNIVNLLDAIEDERGPVMADKVLSYLSAAFTRCAVDDDKFNSPIVRGMARTKTSERARTRTLADDEIRDLWSALDAMPERYAALLRALLLTGARRDELRGATWDEVAGDAWTVSAARSKSAKAHLVPLTASVLAQFGPRRSGFIFSRNGGKSSLGSLSTLKHRLDAKIAARRGKPLADWRLHDLRRSARTLMSRAGVQADIAERTIGHALPGIRATYDLWEFAPEKRAALEQLAALIANIVAPPEGKVVALRQ